MIRTKGLETIGEISEVLEKASGAELLDLVDGLAAIRRILPDEGTNGRLEFIFNMAESEIKHRVRYGECKPRRKY